MALVLQYYSPRAARQFEKAWRYLPNCNLLDQLGSAYYKDSLPQLRSALNTTCKKHEIKCGCPRGGGKPIALKQGAEVDVIIEAEHVDVKTEE